MPKKLSLSQRAVEAAMVRVTKMLQGYTPLFFDELIAMLGIAGFFKWAGLMGKAIEDLDKRWGHAIGQLLIGSAAMWNGCRHCGIGHTYAGNLVWFKEKGELFPLSERRIISMQKLRDEDALAEIERLLGQNHPEIFALYERLFLLKYGEAVPENDDDMLLLRTVAGWDLVNECSIMTDVSDPNEVEPLSWVAKDKPLIARYREARDAEDAAN